MKRKPTRQSFKGHGVAPTGHDNLPLSKQSRPTGRIHNGSESISNLSRIDLVVTRLVQATLAENTRRAYGNDLHHFRKCGGTIPCEVNTLQGYLAHCAQSFSVATVARRLAAIGQAHVALGLPSPTADPAIGVLMRGIRRHNGVAQRQAKPLTRKLLRHIVRSMGADLLACRDRALLLLGFAGAFRRSELVALDVEDLDWSKAGLLVTVRRSKTDQEQRGRTVAIPAVSGPSCPVTALQRWLQSAGIIEGPVFRRFDVHGKLTANRLQSAFVSHVVKSRLKAIGIDATTYSAHSLRAGLVTEAARAGVPGWKIRQQTGHRSETTLARYIRDAQLFENNAACIAMRGRHRRVGPGVSGA